MGGRQVQGCECWVWVEAVQVREVIGGRMGRAGGSICVCACVLTSLCGFVEQEGMAR